MYVFIDNVNPIEYDFMMHSVFTDLLSHGCTHLIRVMVRVAVNASVDMSVYDKK